MHRAHTESSSSTSAALAPGGALAGTRVAVLVALAAGCGGRERPEHVPPAPSARAGAAPTGNALSEPATIVADASTPQAAEDERRAQLVEFVRLGYGDEHDKEIRSLSFRTEELSTDDLQAVVALVPEYNAFVGSNVAEAVERLRGDIGYYQFGREGSPVLYVSLPHWTSQQERNCPGKRCRTGSWGPDTPETRRLTAREHAALVARVRMVLTQLDAGEITVDAGGHELRAWWD